MASKMKCLVAATHAIGRISNRRLIAMDGIGYKILVSIDNSKESWKALEAVLYLADSENDILHTITIKDSQTPDGIKDEIKRVVKNAGLNFVTGNFKITILDENISRTKDRVIEFVKRGNYDIAAVGMQGRKFSDINPQKVMGSFSDPSLRDVTCPMLIAPNCAELPEQGESAIFVVVVDGSMNSQHAYKTARGWLKEGDHLYVINVCDPRGDEPEVPATLRSSYLGRQYFSKNSDLNNATFELLIGQKVVPKIIEFCHEKGAHFLLCGTDQMQTWQNKGGMIGSISDALVREAECFVIISQLQILHQD